MLSGFVDQTVFTRRGSGLGRAKSCSALQINSEVVPCLNAVPLIWRDGIYLSIENAISSEQLGTIASGVSGRRKNYPDYE